MKRPFRGRRHTLGRVHHHMFTRLAAGSVSFASVAAVVALHAPVAQAAYGSFCQDQGYIPGYTNCPVYVSYNPGTFSETEAATYYQNDGDWVCAYVEVPNNHAVASQCAQNEADTHEVTDHLFTNNYFHVGNDSPKPHYVRGYWQAQ